ncbi:GIY-YIG nuclease family protein [Patescibacteria group bacterium]
MYYTCLLKSIKNKWHYIGSTKDLRKRFSEHNVGKVQSTKFYKPFILLYYESYQTYSLARKRELELKNNNQQKEILFKRLGLTE